MPDFMHTPPVSPSSYSVKPSIWRYPWKRSLFTHDDKLASSYSATQRDRILQGQKHKKSSLTFRTQPIYIKSKAEQHIDAWIVRRSQCLSPVSSVGNKEQDTRWAFIDRGQFNNYQTQRAASGRSSEGGYFGSETAQWFVTQWADWESIQR